MKYTVLHLEELIESLDQTIDTAKKSLSLDSSNEIIADMVKTFEEQKNRYQKELDLKKMEGKL